MKKTTGLLLALSLLVLLTNGCSNRQVIPITSNCDKLKNQRSEELSACCKIVDKNGKQLLVNERQHFSLKLPPRWNQSYALHESDRSASNTTDYTLSIRFAPKEKAPKHSANLMVLRVMDPSGWEALPADLKHAYEKLPCKSERRIYLLQIPSDSPFDPRSQSGKQYEAMRTNAKEITEALQLMP